MATGIDNSSAVLNQRRKTGIIFRLYPLIYLVAAAIYGEVDTGDYY